MDYEILMTSNVYVTLSHMESPSVWRCCTTQGDTAPVQIRREKHEVRVFRGGTPPVHGGPPSRSACDKEIRRVFMAAPAPRACVHTRVWPLKRVGKILCVDDHGVAQAEKYKGTSTDPGKVSGLICQSQRFSGFSGSIILNSNEKLF